MGATFGRGLNHNSDRNTGAEFEGINSIWHYENLPAFLTRSCCIARLKCGVTLLYCNTPVLYS